MPAPRHTVRVQLYLAQLGWVVLAEPDILADTLTTIRGLTDDGTQRPGEARLRVRDDAHRYDPDNELSDLYGQIGPRTPIQVEVDGRHDFTGEVAAWKPGESPDWLAGPPQRGYRWTDIVASGPWRRMGQAPKDLPCPQRTRLAQVSLAAWPFDDPAGSQRATPADVGNSPPSLLCPGVAFEAIDGPAGSPRAALVTGTPQWGAPLAFGTTYSTGWSAGVAVWQNGATTGGATRRFWRVFMHTGVVMELWGGTTGWTLTSYNPYTAVTDTYTVPYVVGSAEDPASATWVRWTVYVTTAPGASTAVVTSYGQHGTVTDWPARNYAYEVGFPTRFEGPAYDKLGFCGLQFAYDDMNLPEDRAAFDGHRGERAADRAVRLCSEQYVPIVLQGDPATSEAMGVQAPDTLFNLLKECATTDDGVLVEARTPGAEGANGEVTQLLFRTRRYLFQQGPRLQLTYPQHVARPFGKATDDVTIANVVTAKQRDGGSATARLDSGPYAPGAIGEERRDVAVNVADEAALPAIAEYHLAIGAIPGARYPQLTVDVDVNPGKAEAVQTIEVGDEVQLSGYVPRTVRLSVLGISTTTGSHRRTVTLALLPAAHRRFGIWDLGQAGPYGDRWNAISNLQTTVSASATSIIIESDLFNTWAHAGTPHAALPYDWLLGGERVRVTAITAPTPVGERYRQTATVVRSVNGVSRGHGAGTAVTLYDPIYYVR